MDFNELNQLARVHVSEKVPDQSRQSLPVPAHLNESLCIAFFFSPAQSLPGVTRLAPPNFIAWLRRESGELAQLQAVTSKTFGLKHAPGELIGEFRLPAGMTADLYLTERGRLFDLYPALVTAWNGKMPPQQPGLKPSAQEFLRLFGLISEPPLIAYYHALGSKFFEWVRAAARS